ncbi:MAG: amino acid adenylation domain-containing protein, partial [Acidobacteriaceae bacterium]|nr:amino acid adenylation domain-containing protein [Acidobacteriaceae bacterium]
MAQYFPDLDYLLDVMAGAVEAVGPEGTVFLGDLRSLPLLEMFQTSVQMYQAADTLTVEQLRRRVRLNMAQEGELLLDPELFAALRQRIPKIRRIDVQLKRGRAHNELTRFRYDVTLHISETPVQTVDCAWVDWQKESFNLELLRHTLRSTQPDMLGLTGVPNARLREDVAALEVLLEATAETTVGDVRERVQHRLAESRALDPEDLWALERELPYRVEIRASQKPVDGCSDVVLRRIGAGAHMAFAEAHYPGQAHAFRPLSHYANNPLRARTAAQLIPQLRSWLYAKLPEYMVPQAFVLLDALPLTSNGKIDRKALPAPELSPDAVEYVPPRTPAERKLAEIWSAVLQAPRIGARDNFFALGGHSLLATQVISRVRLTMGTDLPLRSIFESPTLEALAARIAKTTRSVQIAAIPHTPRNRPLPLSSAQERLWFLDQLAPDNSFYSAPLAMRLKGPLDPNALRDAVNGLIRRHEVLRTTYRLQNDRPVQVTAPELRIDVPIIDVSFFPLERRETEARQRMVEEARRPFDLRTGPVLRAFLVRLDEMDHALLLNIHHIATDGWSIWPFIQELGTLYKASVAGEQSPLSELPIQYADFAVWHREWLESEEVAQQFAYWKNQLAGAPERMELPTDRPRPTVQTYRGAIETIVLPVELLDALRALSQRENATLYMTLLATFQILLFRYTGQEKIVVGSPIANRTRAEIEDLIGFFVNTLVMYSDLSGNPTFREFLQRVREVALGAFSNQDLPFEKLVKAIAPDRDLSVNPLVQVLFVLQNPRRSILQLAGVEFESMQIHNGTTKFDIAMFLVERPEGLSCWAEYSTDLFDAATIRRFLGHYQVLLEAIIENTERRISELPLLTEAEQHQLLAEWNKPSTHFLSDICVHNAFERQVERTPNKIAVICEDHELTYAELNRRSNQLAHRLCAMGVSPETLVALCMERSLDMLVGILAILKAGGGYLPVDPAYPCDRVAFMLRDAQVQVLITQEALLPAIPPHDAAVVCIDRDWPSIASEAGENLVPQAKPEDVAYVIYTSGSTGNPKGCLITHANVARLFTSTHHWFGFGPEDTWTLFHSIAFDFSVWEIWGALLFGGKLVVVPLMLARSPEQFHELLVRHQVTVLNQTPSAFKSLIAADERSYSSHRLALRYVIFGGEALEFKNLLPWIARHGDRPALINMYGITETTVHVTYFKVNGPGIGDNSVSRIGKPIPDLQVYVLDRNRQPVPIGVPGEMYVGGAGVARGYLNRPEL